MTADVRELVARALWESQRSRIKDQNGINARLTWRDRMAPEIFWRGYELDADAILALQSSSAPVTADDRMEHAVEAALRAFYKHTAVQNFPQASKDQMERALEAALTALQREWQPIDTAPKDGSYVLTFTPSRDPPYAILKWYEDAERPVRSKWVTEDLGWYFRGPTHWQPLHEPQLPISRRMSDARQT